MKHKVKQALPNLIVFVLSKTQHYIQNLLNFGGFQNLCNRSLYHNLHRTRHTDPKPWELFRVPKQQLRTDLAIPLWFSWQNWGPIWPSLCDSPRQWGVGGNLSVEGLYLIFNAWEPAIYIREQAHCGGGFCRAHGNKAHTARRA